MTIKNNSQNQAGSRSVAGYIGRTVIVVIAFFLAALVALAVLMLLGSWTMGEELRGDYQPGGDMNLVVQIVSLLFGGASFFTVLAPTLTAWPALLAVIIGEVVQIRSLLYYLVAGGLALAVLPVLDTPRGTALDFHGLAIFASAGFAGGLIYWALAGKRA